MDIKIYTTPTCGFCHQAKKYLSDLGVNYSEYDVSVDRAAADEMVSLTGQMGVPVIVVDGQAIVGFDRPRLEQLLAGGSRKHPRFGIKVADASRMARKPGEPPVFGALVGPVAPSSPGERAGIMTGDVITEVNRKRVNNVAELEQITGTLNSGTRVAVTFYRGEKAIKSEIAI
ncbi:glutaredoxin domain-containing protein [Chloroflexota bacterium]